MSLNLRKCNYSGMKRSNSLPVINSIFENKAVAKFFSWRNSSDSESSSSLESIIFSIERKNDSDDEERRTKEVSKIHLHPKAGFSTKLPIRHVQDPETWKQRFLRVFRNITRRIRRYFRN
ncbi:hypothetical protein CDAR_231921 [Caerostris darwini]|uniref:Uncharacterized protein n=1 Tax=Caerostris darwini TaxID=1538125 RepID=A0AAV4N691_9ARAC|nr:hypothetical protein CDAR_231921 [Caerostris darwini]